MPPAELRDTAAQLGQRWRRFVLTQHSAARWTRTLGLAFIVGVAAGLAAFALAWGLHFGSEHLVGRVSEPGSAAAWQFRWELLLLPALGAVVAGLAVRLLVGRIGGQGTDAMVHAFHQENGELALSGPTVKAAASIATIASGGSAGPEGPSAALGAAIGSSAGGLVGVTPRERRTLLVAGCAAAVGAIFGCPLGGALFAASVQYRRPEFEGSSLVSAFVASAVGYTTFSQVWGRAPRVLAEAGGLEFASPGELPLYALLGIVCGLTAIFFSVCLRTGERICSHLRAVPSGLRPGLGGLVTGALACALPQVIDGEYRVVQAAFDGSFFGAPPEAGAWLPWAGFLALLALAKCVATGSTVGSGAPGGVLGPSLAIGAYAGAAFGAGASGVAPGWVDESLRQALIPVGMAGVLAAAMRTPIAAMAMVMEMTGSFGLIVPLMLCTMTAYVVGGRFGVVSAQMETSADSPAHAGDALISLLERQRVAEVMETRWPYTARPATPIGALLRDLRPGVHPTVPVLDGERLVGTVSMDELQFILDEPDVGGALIAADVVAQQRTLLEPGDSLYEAMHQFETQGAEALPVVSDRATGTYLGMLSRSAVFERVRDHMDSLQKGFRREHAALVESREVTHLLGVVSAADKRSLDHVPVAHDWVGRSLRELDFRRAFGSQVLAVQTATRAVLHPPDPSRPLEAGDVLLVVRAEPDAGSELGA
ncbi:MAG: chloride channel protein [Deltaproteobacteria bacterium]|nr:chloride channel protein [Deltaproteobacteria bacterium]MBW2360522.1 chloride channel protein [Deltaproteobacteria bacterium]